LAGIKAAGEAGDWQAWEAFLRMSFPADYRRDASVNVNAIATAQQAALCATKRRASA
jgi:1,2-phenylacetyl-CoA epoxidase PaaB subunit